MNVICIVGLQWGDEGKGKIVDALSENAKHVARFQGGHNAGHTIIQNSQKIILHLLPSGVLRKNVSCYIGDGVVISTTALLNEIEMVEKITKTLKGRLFISRSASLILPHHVMLDKHRESKDKPIGTTLRGIGPAHEDKIARRAIRIYDLYNKTGKNKIIDNVKYYSKILKKNINTQQILNELNMHAKKIKPYLCDDIGIRLSKAATNKDAIILEGAQGVMLDIQQGTYPFVTSSQCIPSATAGGLGVELFPSIYGITKAYATRVGEGPFPTELKDSNGIMLGDTGDEIGATTGRKRRCGWIDIPMIKHAILVSGCKNIVMTKLDVLDNFDKIGICTGYKLNNKNINYMPHDPEDLDKCQPIYEYFKGWQKNTGKIKKYENLPTQAKKYIKKIEKLIGLKIKIISNGPERNQIIKR